MNCEDQEDCFCNSRYKLLAMNNQKGGVYGLIRKALDTTTGKVVAIKEIRQTVSEEGVEPSEIREINALRVLKACSNVVELLDYFMMKDKFFLVFPFIEVNLREYMTASIENSPDGRMEPHKIKVLMKKLLSAVCEAHNSRIIHRDIKPENILIENPHSEATLQLKLADWGSSRFFNFTSKSQNFTEEVIPLAYRAPEILFSTKNYSCSVDTWSVGCLFAELLFGERIFQSTNENTLLFEIIERLGITNKEDEEWLSQQYCNLNFEGTAESLQEYREDNLRTLFGYFYGEPSEAEDLLKKMLRLHPEKRISAQDALNHKYFDNWQN